MNDFADIAWHDAKVVSFCVTGTGRVTLEIVPVSNDIPIRLEFLGARSVEVDCDLLALTRVGVAVMSAGAKIDGESRANRLRLLDGRFRLIQSRAVAHEALTEFRVTFVAPAGSVAILAAGFRVSYPEL